MNKYKLDLAQDEAWEWSVTLCGRQMAGGYAATREDAEHDAKIWMAMHPRGLCVAPASGGVHRWTYGDWSGTAHLPTDARAAIRFEWDQEEVPAEYETIEELILEEIC